MTRTATTRTIPHHDLRLPDGRKLRYQRSWVLPETVDGATYLSTNGLRVIASIDVASRFGPLLHVSLSYRTIDPTWAEIAAVKDLFFGPTIDAMMLLPKEEDYVHGVPGWEDSRVFHLWETPEKWGMS